MYASGAANPQKCPYFSFSVGRPLEYKNGWARIQRHDCIELRNRRNIVGNVSGYEFMRRPIGCVIFETLDGGKYGKEDKSDSDSG